MSSELVNLAGKLKRGQLGEVRERAAGQWGRDEGHRG